MSFINYDLDRIVERQYNIEMKANTPLQSPRGQVTVRTVSHHERGSPLGDKEGAVG